MECQQRHRLHWSSARSINSAQIIRALFVRLVLILTFPIVLGSLQACGGGEGRTPVPSNIQSITIDPVNPTVAVGTSLQLHATVNYKNKKTKDVTTSATWVSADPTIANVSNASGSEGVTNGASAGPTTIRAKFGGQTGTTTFTVTNVTLKSITVTPVNPVITKGTTVQLAAHGTFSDGSVQDLTNQVTWSSGNSDRNGQQHRGHPGVGRGDGCRENADHGDPQRCIGRNHGHGERRDGDLDYH